MRWILPVIVLLLTWALFFVVPYAARVGQILMGNMGWLLLPGALIVAYIGFVGPLWIKAIKPFRSVPDAPFWPTRPEA